MQLGENGLLCQAQADGSLNCGVGAFMEVKGAGCDQVPVAGVHVTQDGSALQCGARVLVNPSAGSNSWPASTAGVKKNSLGVPVALAGTKIISGSLRCLVADDVVCSSAKGKVLLKATSTSVRLRN